MLPETGAQVGRKARPKLVLFTSRTSGPCRRADGLLAQVLQRRANHHTFELLRVDVADRPELAKQLRVDSVPTILVIDERRVASRIVRPTKCGEVEDGLRLWLH